MTNPVGHSCYVIGELITSQSSAAPEEEYQAVVKLLTEKVDTSISLMRSKMHVSVYSWMVTFLNVYKMDCLRNLSAMKNLYCSRELKEKAVEISQEVDEIVEKAKRYNTEFHRNQEKIQAKITQSVTDLETGEISLLFPPLSTNDKE